MRKTLLFSTPCFTWQFVNAQSRSRLISGTVADNCTEAIMAGTVVPRA